MLDGMHPWLHGAPNWLCAISAAIVRQLAQVLEGTENLIQLHRDLLGGLSRHNGNRI